MFGFSCEDGVVCLLEVAFGLNLDHRIVCPSIGTMWSTWIGGLHLHAQDQMCRLSIVLRIQRKMVRGHRHVKTSGLVCEPRYSAFGSTTSCKLNGQLCFVSHTPQVC